MRDNEDSLKNIYNCHWLSLDQDQDQDSLLVKRRNDNHSPGPVIRELVPSSHQRSESGRAFQSLIVWGKKLPL